MKIKIDTDNKTITVLDSNNLALLVKYLKKILDKDYDKYTFQPEMTYTYWSNPIYIQPYTIQPWSITTTNTGTYNVEIQEGTKTSNSPTI